jgi:hypothetical protein
MSSKPTAAPCTSVTLVPVFRESLTLGIVDEGGCGLARLSLGPAAVEGLWAWLGHGPRAIWTCRPRCLGPATPPLHRSGSNTGVDVLGRPPA